MMDKYFINVNDRQDDNYHFLMFYKRTPTGYRELFYMSCSGLEYYRDDPEELTFKFQCSNENIFVKDSKQKGEAEKYNRFVVAIEDFELCPKEIITFLYGVLASKIEMILETKDFATLALKASTICSTKRFRKVEKALKKFASYAGKKALYKAREKINKDYFGDDEIAMDFEVLCPDDFQEEEQEDEEEEFTGRDYEQLVLAEVK